MRWKEAKANWRENCMGKKKCTFNPGDFIDKKSNGKIKTPFENIKESGCLDENSRAYVQYNCDLKDV